MEIFGVYLVNRSSGATIPLFQDKENYIGRGIPNPQGEKGKVLFPDPSISKIHATIAMDPNTFKWILTDKSRHGIYVNEKKVNQSTDIHHGDRIDVGSFTLMFYEKFNADDETMEQPLPVIFQQQRASYNRWKWGFYILFPLVIELLLALISPLTLLGISCVVLVFSVILLVKKSWRENIKVTLTAVIISILFSLLGILIFSVCNYNPEANIITIQKPIKQSK
ncbi:MAG: FHA domain-containing protein [Planctomycetes bacterium]|jgi:pSer/pThr/pTyr-binding forkhead associated (FHA) protein|nr:FHA domain-containing protein [Planctomycetota bacterium]HNZ66159.1 FHA domain-containing protein [Planctomycetota bacterium]HPY74352.1 FHA domain-containing protein [Planctomycetota bacterium]HQA99882.1 FHA domain-containing protein [Planctomycetota bacterium]